MASEESMSMAVIVIFAVILVIIAMIAIPRLSSGIPGFLSKALD